MASFNGNSYCEPETREQRRARALNEARKARARVAALSKSAKTKLLARAIVDAAAKRGTVSLHDGIQAGLTRAEVEAHFGPAMEVARTMEPRLTGMGALS